MPPKVAQIASAAAPASKKATYPPNQTLYITNLPSSKIQKADLRASLYTLFSTYGPVLDVVALKTMKMRGQAHIVFRDINTATQAMRALQGFNFLGLDMKIEYAKTKSDTLAKLTGTFHKPAAAAGEVTATELQQSIFNAPPSSSSKLPPPAPGLPARVVAADIAMEEAASPAAGSVTGQKRRREEDDDEEQGEEESDGDAAMEEDSDDD